MNEPTSPPRFVLRNLPLAPKLVLTVFLLSVGVGYVSAMVQLHFRQAGPTGEVLPTSEQVVKRFHGDPKDTKSRLEGILEGPREGPFGKQNMVPAFFEKSGSSWEKKKDIPGEPERRDGERKALLAWVKAGALRSQFERFPLPKDWGNQPISGKYLDEEHSNQVKISSLVFNRCKHCHEEGGQAGAYLLEKYEDIAKYAKPGGPEMSLEGLTQSTHAHLLSFAMLYALSGLIFAFSSYPTWFKVLLAPIVLVAQVLDVSCWWLARIPGPWGETFAHAIIATGAVVGVGLALQIVLGLFNLYGAKGKVVLLLLFAAAGTGAWYAHTTVIAPYLAIEKAEMEALHKQQETEKKKAEEEAKKAEQEAKEAEKEAKKQEEEEKKKAEEDKNKKPPKTDKEEPAKPMVRDQE
jgi:hypothetical protein